MIRYRLQCEEGHEFEAWFASSTAYESQETEGQLNCPVCGGVNVKRAIMAPQIAHARSPESTSQAPSTGTQSAHSSALLAATPEAQQLKVMMKEVRALRDQILAKSEYVGPRFAEEARRIHFDESPDRAIHGEATAEDVNELAEDGIDVLPMPRLPDDLS